MPDVRALRIPIKYLANLLTAGDEEPVARGLERMLAMRYLGAKRENGGLAFISIVSVIVLANLLYGAVFAPHLVTKLGGYVTSGPSEQLFPGVPNQPK